MIIYVKFTMTTRQIWSCHVTLASNSENFYFSPNSIFNFREITKFGGNWLKNKKVQAKSKLGGGKHPPNPSAYWVNRRLESTDRRQLPVGFLGHTTGKETKLCNFQIWTEKSSSQ